MVEDSNSHFYICSNNNNKKKKVKTLIKSGGNVKNKRLVILLIIQFELFFLFITINYLIEIGVIVIVQQLQGWNKIEPSTFEIV